MQFKALPVEPTRNMIEAAYMLPSTMPSGTPGRDRELVREIWRQMAALAPKPLVGGLTRRQQRYLDFIIEYIDEHHGQSPTYEEIARFFGVNKGDAYKVVKAIARRSFVEIAQGTARNIRVIRRPGLD